MAKIYTAFRLSAEIVQEIELRSVETRVDKTAVVEQALRLAFGLVDEQLKEPLNNNVLHRLTVLEKSNNSVLQRLTKLEKLLNNGHKELTSSSSDLDVEPCSARALSKRLGFASHHPVSKRKDDANFPDWSVIRDPNGIAWEYKADSELFYPLAS